MTEYCRAEDAALLDHLPSMHQTRHDPQHSVNSAWQPTPWEVGGKSTQGHPQLHREFEASLFYMRFCLKRFHRKHGKVSVSLSDVLSKQLVAGNPCLCAK